MTRNTILPAIDDAIRAVQYLKQPESLCFIESAVEMIVSCYRNGGKLILAGNGGSLCDASHFAEEMTGQFRARRPALAAIALTDAGHLTCVGNDMGFEWVFARGIEALGKPGDLFIALTTSGQSANLIHALAQAKKMGLHTMAFLGKSGGAMKGVADLEWIVSGFPFSDRIQEAHMAAIHITIEAVEERLFSPSVREDERIAMKR